MGTNQIEPVFNAILSLVIIKILDIPCKRTNSKVIINSRAGFQNMTLLRNATTKKNRHCYGVKLSTDSNILLRD